MILNKLKEKQIPYLIKSKKIKNGFLALFLIGDFFLRKFLVRIEYLKFKRKAKIISLIRDFKVSQDSILKLDQIPDITEFKAPHASLNAITKRDFDSIFNDPEEFFKLHRFNWLWTEYIPSSDVDAFQEGLGLIKSWISKEYDMQKNRDIFESYSISERTINWILFLIYSKGIIKIDEKDLKIISQSIIKQLDHLAKNLEFKGQLTNNHILKNAQALYIGGAFLQDEKIKELGRAIITEEYDEHITDGYLQEDSTHYQLIISRWFLEVFYSATVTKDLEFQKWLKPRLQALLSVCRKTFLADGTGPLFGDISPDLSVETLQSFPFLDSPGKKSPWSFLVSDLDIKSNVLNSKVKNMWIHKKIGKFDLFVMAKNKGIGSHGHEDNGSFVLFCNGSAIVQDPGRKDYTADSISIEQQNQAFHSIPCVDHNPWDIKTIPTVVKSLFISKIKILEESDVLFKYKISSFDGTVVLERKFIYNSSNQCLSLQDKLVSKHDNYSLTLPLDCPTGSLTVADSKVSFSLKDQKKYFVSSQCKFELQEFFISKNYGKQNNCTLLSFKKSLNPNEVIEYTFGCEDNHA